MFAHFTKTLVLNEISRPVKNNRHTLRKTDIIDHQPNKSKIMIRVNILYEST